MGHIARIKEIEWAKNWGWQMFNVNLACGALSVVISTIPYSFNGQHAIGCIFYIANIVVYLFNICMTLRRIYRHPKIWKNSFYDQKEAVWFPVPTVAMATLIIGTLLYGAPYTGPWLVVACEIWFWIYCALAVMVGLTMQSTLRTIARPLSEIAPPDALEIYPLMFIGVIGSTLVGKMVDQHPNRALTVAVFSYVFAGLGFFIGLLKLSVWVHKDMISASAAPEIIPSYLISVGVPGFPSLTLINLSQSIGTVAEKNDFLTGLPGQSGQEAARVIAIVSVLLSLLLVGMATWFLIVFLGFAIMSIIREPKKPFNDRWQFTWWSWTFPLTGVVLTFGRLGTIIPSMGFSVLNIIFVCGMSAVFLVNCVGTVRMVWIGQLPGSSQEFDKEKIKKEQMGEA